jgi:DNA-binding GntR family transcriptional regulator
MADPTTVRSLADHQSLRERIVSRLRNAIVAGDLPPKTRLMEPELAKRLSVSRTPLREAIRQLEAEGFLTTIPRVGTFVSEVTPRALEDIYAIRAVLEGLAARQAAENPDPAKATFFTPILAELAKKTADYREYHEAAGRFHEAIFAFSGNQPLQAMYHTLTHQVARLRTLSLAMARRPEVSLREHRRIASAILRGKGTEAERLMRSHIQGALAVLRRRIRAGRDGRDTGVRRGGTPTERRSE